MQSLFFLAGRQDVLCGLCLLVCFFAGARRADAQQELYYPLKGQDTASTVTRVGTNAEQFVRFEPDGTRISIPGLSVKNQTQVGIATDVILHGDFEITVAFEMLQEPAPEQASDFGTRLSVIAGVESPNQSQAKLARAVRPKGGNQFLAFSARWDAAKGTHEKRMKDYPTASRSGRLRVVRSGPTLSFHAAEGSDGPFALLREYGFNTADLQGVQVLGSTGRPEAPLDVRITDLRIRADSLGNLPGDEKDARVTPVSDVPRRRWLAVTTVVLVLIVCTAVVGWLFNRRRIPPRRER
jgi:hypothetical protein